MAFTAFSRTRLDPGTIESVQVDLPANHEALARLDASNAEWDDPDLLVTVTLERSFDGGATWTVMVSATIPGGTRPRGGGLPTVSAQNADQDAKLRYKFSRNKRSNLGLIGDVSQLAAAATR